MSIVIQTQNRYDYKCLLNKDTGKVTLGMTGTNVNKDASETLKDFGADVNIGLHIVTDKDPHYKNTQDFIKNIKKTMILILLPDIRWAVEMRDFLINNRCV